MMTISQWQDMQSFQTPSDALRQQDPNDFG